MKRCEDSVLVLGVVTLITRARKPNSYVTLTIVQVP